MKVSELRINNLVRQIDANHSKVVSVVGIHLRKDRDDEVDTAYIEQINPIMTVYDRVTIEKIQPVNLSEEWLLKFGFVLDESVGVWFGHKFNGTSLRFTLWAAYSDKPIRYTRHLPDDVIDILYVHQLQNLYFGLTGEELQLNG